MLYIYKHNWNKAAYNVFTLHDGRWREFLYNSDAEKPVTLLNVRLNKNY